MVRQELIQVYACADMKKEELWFEITKSTLCNKLGIDSNELKALCDKFAQDLELLIKE